MGTDGLGIGDVLDDDSPEQFQVVDTLDFGTCFYIRKGHRRQGVTSALITAALESARRGGAGAVEAYPLDAGRTPSTSHTGYASTFARAGFRTVAGHEASRPVMRYHFDHDD